MANQGAGRRDPRRWLGAVASAAIPLLFAPGSAGAYSFLPAGFDPGEKILSIELVSSDVMGALVEVDAGSNPSDPADDLLFFQANVSTIRTNKDGETLYTIPLGDVTVQGTFEFASFPLPWPGFYGVVAAEFSHPSLVDLTILDTGPGAGDPMLLELDFSTALGLQAQVLTGVMQGSMGGDLDVVGGEAGFVEAFGSSGDLAGVLTGFNPGGSNICVLTNYPLPGCEDAPLASDLADFTANATSTITPTVIPEPGTLALLGLALAGLTGLRRRF